MEVLICFKWERDSNDAAISSDGSLKWFENKLKPSDDDAAAIVCARQIATDTNGNLTAVTIGDGDATWALARGATRAVSVGNYMPAKDEAVTAARLANAIKATGHYDVIVMGDAQEFAGVAPIIASILEIPIVAGVADVGADPEDPGCLIAHRTTTQAQETLKIQGPALVSVMAASTEKNFPTMRQIMAAKRFPVDKLDGAQMEAIVENRVIVRESRLPERRRVQLFEGDKAVDKLVAALKSNEIL